MRATYRLQLSPELDFAAVAELVPYLRDLGISHLYLSPSLQARAGSTHGYDVVDPTRVSATLGGEEGLRALADTAQRLGVAHRGVRIGRIGTIARAPGVHLLPPLNRRPGRSVGRDRSGGVR